MMNLSRQRAMAIVVASVGAPLALVHFGRTLVSSPAPVLINTGPAPAPALTPVAAQPATALTPEQEKAAEWVAKLPTKYELKSPLNHPVDLPPPVAPTTPQAEAPKAEPPPVPRINPILGLRLTAVLGNEDEQLASINGKIYKIGDVVRKGLKLSAIDQRNARIILTEDDGTTYVIKREIKSIDR
jgi:hypothetical protein